jgi:Fe-Mn family superoxide dismutase
MVDSGSSPESIKLDFLAAASAQFGGGFVWLVSQRKDGLLRILNTYNAGTPYSEAFARQQPVDMNTEPAKKAGGWYNPDSFSNQGVSANTAPGGNPITPLLCVNTWEHAWLYDYGFDGKDEYLERWWDRVDWNLVENAHKESPGYNGNMHSRTL